ncbi:hypothetical protein Cch01nite_32950 [Cellulomonas chitinilytica]|uniref:Signal peptidase I n=1 Tax=Cellulomonas chitinilytica TaxID=398759 RepID=A0A919P373_9CELL|nr:signal peptidase I [Cellulomonas chitinilytica]GIG22571.1 hypothetical protein Cch01nite_32950 [Cellulomonas chitinilytica]
MTTTTAATPTTPVRRRGPRWRAVVPWTSVVVVAIVAAFLWPTAWGGSTSLTIVAGHSMEPTLVTGDLVVGRSGPVAVGDVVVYQPDDVDGHVVHRVVGGSATEGWVMRGDNNTWDDIWTPTSDDVVGVVRWRLPHVGSALTALTSPTAWVALVLLVAGWYLWPAREEAELVDESEEAAEAEGEVRRA